MFQGRKVLMGIPALIIEEDVLSIISPLKIHFMNIWLGSFTVTLSVQDPTELFSSTSSPSLSRDLLCDGVTDVW
jgi:hypothetical protein